MGRVGGVVPAEEATENDEEDKHEVEGIPALLDRIGFENLGGEKLQRGNYDQSECECNHQNAHEKCTGAQEQRVRAAQAAATAAFRPEWWPRVFFFFFFHFGFPVT